MFHLLRFLSILVLISASQLSAQLTWTPSSTSYALGWTAATWDSARERVVALTFRTVPRTEVTTIEWNGRRWSNRRPQTVPPGSNQPVLAYDAARRETLLFYSVNGVAQTWTWNGLDWTQRSPNTMPPARRLHSLAYDPVRERIVLFGGVDIQTRAALGDTWLWDGQNWQNAQPANSPTARQAPSCAWEPISQRILLFGGSSGLSRLGDTWAWDGSDWSMLAPAVSPPASNINQMATDERQQRTVLFTSSSGRWNETWMWDGASWTQVMTTTSPASSASSVLAFDGNSGGILGSFGAVSGPIRQESLAFDGTQWSVVDELPVTNIARLVTDSNRGTVFMHTLGTYSRATTWEWDSDRWHARRSNTAPPAGLNGFALAHDSARNRTVLFGGTATGQRRNETWEWDGTSWQQMAVTNRPAPRISPGMAYDAARGECVMYGGSGQGLLSDTWVWDGSSWTERFPATVPMLVSGPGVAYDEARQRVVMLNTPLYGSVTETWEWDGFDWARNVTAATPPRANINSAPTAYDPVNQRIVRTYRDQTWTYDGIDWSNAPSSMPLGVELNGIAWDPRLGRMIGTDRIRSTTWILGSSAQPAATSTFGSGCAGSSGVPTLASSLPYAGTRDLVFEIASARASAPAALQLALSGTTTGVPIGAGCTLLAAGAGSLLAAFAAPTSRAGFAELQLSIPPATTLLGVMLDCQGIVLDAAGAGAGPVATTNGLRLTVGL